MKKIFLFVILILSAISNLFAQLSATGCYTSWDNATHTFGPYGANNVYANNTGKVVLLLNYCGWTPTTTSSNCRVCPGWLITSGSNTGRCQVSELDNTSLATQAGYYGTFTMVRCPLDEYTPMLLLTMAPVAFWLLRRKNYLYDISLI